MFPALGGVAALAGRYWKPLAIGVAALLLIFLVWKILAWRSDAQKLDEAQEIGDEERKQLEAENKAKDEFIAERDRELEEERQRSAAFASQAQQATALAGSLTVQLDALSRRSSALRTEIRALPESELEPRIKRDLGLRHPDDAARPGFLREELVAIADCVSQAPLLEQQRLKQAEQVAALTTAVESLRGEVGSLKEQQRLTEQKYLKTEETLQRALGHYATLYNAVGPRKRAPRCLWLWKCADNKMPVPAPQELAAEVSR